MYTTTSYGSAKVVSQVLSLRIPDKMAERLDRFARAMGNGSTRSKAGIILLEEALRESEFAGIEFRDSSIGRQAYLKASGLAVWEVIMVSRAYEMEADKTAQHFQRPLDWVQAALNYYTAYQREIDQAIEDNNIGYEKLRQMLPGLQLVNGGPVEEATGS
jgi:predicted transcriptional regulator